jgi:hypothetical protein
MKTVAKFFPNNKPGIRKDTLLLEEIFSNSRLYKKEDFLILLVPYRPNQKKNDSFLSALPGLLFQK